MTRILAAALATGALLASAPAAGALDFGSLSTPTQGIQVSAQDNFIAGGMAPGRYVWLADCTHNPEDTRWVPAYSSCENSDNVRIMDMNADGGHTMMSTVAYRQ